MDRVHGGFMKKTLNIALGILGFVGLGVSTTKASTGGTDFGRRYGASGYITNMPLYFKGPSVKKEKTHVKKQSHAKKTSEKKIKKNKKPMDHNNHVSIKETKIKVEQELAKSQTKQSQKNV
jgi:hypothetical protein